MIRLENNQVLKFLTFVDADADANAADTWCSTIALRERWSGELKTFRKKVKVNEWLLFFQTLLGSCPQCCIPSPMRIGPLVPQKEILKGFYHIWAGCHLGHVT